MKLKKVSIEEFEEFLDEYPKQLFRSTTVSGGPRITSFRDLHMINTDDDTVAMIDHEYKDETYILDDEKFNEIKKKYEAKEVIE